MSSILVSRGIALFSFCNPSRGPTSTILTWSAAYGLEVLKPRTSCRRTAGGKREGHFIVNWN